MPLNTHLMTACLEGAKSKLSSVKSELGLGPAVNSALTVAQEYEKVAGDEGLVYAEGLGNFPFRTVALPVVIGLHSAKPRLCEMCLALLHHLLQEQLLPPKLAFDNFVFQSSRADSIVGKPVLWVIIEALVQTLGVVDLSVQGKALDCLITASLDLRLDITGPTLEQIVRGCFNLRLTTKHDTIQLRAMQALQTVLKDRVVKLFVTSCRRGPGAPAAARHQFHLTVPASPARLSRQTTSSGLEASGDGAALAVGPPAVDESDAMPDGCHAEPTTYAEMPIPVATCYACGLSEPLTHDLRLMLHILLSLAVRSIPTTVSDTLAIEVRSRVVALELVHFVVDHIDQDNVVAQHLALFPDIFSRLRKEFWRCVARNLCYSIPFALFRGGVRLLTQIALKGHHMHHDDIRWFHDLVVAPLLKSRFSTFDMKIELLSFYRAVLGRPEVAVCYFANYDCLRGAFAAGTLETFVRTVTELLYLDFGPATNGSYGVIAGSGSGGASPTKGSAKGGKSGSGAGNSSSGGDAAADGPGMSGAKDPSTGLWAASSAVVLSHDQAEHLTFEAASVIAEHTTALVRWLEAEEDPVPDDQGTFAEAELDEDVHAGTGDPLDGTTVPNSVATQPLTVSEGYCPVKYHWRHIHQIRLNLRTVAEGCRRFAVNWRDGLAYLRDHHAIDGSAASLVKFVRAHRVDRTQLCAIFERCKKDTFCADFVKGYFATFDYTSTPLDIAMRDTTLEFMSFERPQFESQVWEYILFLFSLEYSTQSTSGLTQVATDTLANVILFLHTNLHNPRSVDKMKSDDYIRYALECIAPTTLPEDELRAMYNRVAAQMWARKVNPLADMHAVIDSDALGLAVKEPSKQSMLDSAEIDGAMAAYAENFSHLSRMQQSSLLLMQLVSAGIERFTSVVKASDPGGAAIGTGAQAEGGGWWASTRVALPAFVPPFYAQHVLPMAQVLGPYIQATAYFASRSASSVRQLRLAQQLYARLDDLRSAFGLLPCEFDARSSEVIHACLRQALAAPMNHCDPTIALHMLHRGS